MLRGFLHVFDHYFQTSSLYQFLSQATSRKHLRTKVTPDLHLTYSNQRTNGPVDAHLISWPSKAQNIQNLENIK